MLVFYFLNRCVVQKASDLASSIRLEPLKIDLLRADAEEVTSLLYLEFSRDNG
jgi:hypothetical protein